MSPMKSPQSLDSTLWDNTQLSSDLGEFSEASSLLTLPQVSVFNHTGSNLPTCFPKS